VERELGAGWDNLMPALNPVCEAGKRIIFFPGRICIDITTRILISFSMAMKITGRHIFNFNV